MKKLLILAFCSFLVACNQEKNSVVATSAGVFHLNSNGQIYRIDGNKLVELKADKLDPEKGILKTYSQEIPGKDGKILVDLKAKIYPDKTNYIIKITRKLNPDKAAENQDKELKFTGNSVMGIKSITVATSDSDDFSVGQDYIPFNNKWLKVVDSSGKVRSLEYKDSFISESARFSELTKFTVQWVED